MMTLDQYKENVRAHLKERKADPAEYHTRAAASLTRNAWDIVNCDPVVMGALDAEEELARAAWHVSEALKAIRKGEG